SKLVKQLVKVYCDRTKKRLLRLKQTLDAVAARSMMARWNDVQAARFWFARDGFTVWGIWDLGF
ncbi:Hypothetical predicted protein, partial [Olea europaea subsp. europaea]